MNEICRIIEDLVLITLACSNDYYQIVLFMCIKGVDSQPHKQWCDCAISHVCVYIFIAREQWAICQWLLLNGQQCRIPYNWIIIIRFHMPIYLSMTSPIIHVTTVKVCQRSSRFVKVRQNTSSKSWPIYIASYCWLTNCAHCIAYYIRNHCVAYVASLIYIHFILVLRVKQCALTEAIYNTLCIHGMRIIIFI